MHVAGVIVECGREDEQLSLELESILAEVAAAKDELASLDAEMPAMSRSHSDDTYL